MGERIVSEKQRDWLAHVEACSRAGGSMKAYAERHGLNLQQFYLWKGRLRKLGMVPDKPGASPQPFEAVHVAAPAPFSAQIAGKTCIQLANGVSIEAPADFNAQALVALLTAAMDLP